MTHHLLVIEQTPSVIRNYLDCASVPGMHLRCESTQWDSLLFDGLSQCKAELILAVAVPPPDRAISLFKWLKDHQISTPTLAILSDEVNEETLRDVYQSVDDFMLWPIHKDELRYRLKRILGSERDTVESVHSRLTESIGLSQLVGKDPAFIQSIEMARLIVKSDLPVLITGETGTGKELFARAIHHLSKRRNFPFIAVDCGAIPDHLFENELFGHVRGAFTDAHSEQKGLIAMASGGTLFLDEVDALSLNAQAKLLRLLQERTYKPLGADRFVEAKINIITATNRPIEHCVREKQFRNDLYFRLNVLRLELPPLIKRRSDIQLLARHFLQRQGANEPVRKSFSPAALRKLDMYDWPGNVRELLNVVQRAAVFSEGSYILPHHIAIDDSGTTDEASENFRLARSRAIEAFEKRYVEDLLNKHKGNITRAAVEAGKDRRAFGRLKKKYKIES
jgi:DNA-binding NtrC family response regulator